jgi:hypothetical protein
LEDGEDGEGGEGGDDGQQLDVKYARTTLLDPKQRMAVGDDGSEYGVGDGGSEYGVGDGSSEYGHIEYGQDITRDAEL